MVSFTPEQIHAELTLDFKDSCNSRCCRSFFDRKVYVNPDGTLETFKDAKVTTGDEKVASIERLESTLEVRIAQYTSDVKDHLEMIQNLSDINFEVMKDRKISLTTKQIQKINEALKEVAKTISESPPVTPL